MVKNKKHYSERFIVTSSGDYSVGIDSERYEIDVIIPELTDKNVQNELTALLRQFFGEYFEDATLTECITLAEENERYQNEGEGDL